MTVSPKDLSHLTHKEMFFRNDTSYIDNEQVSVLFGVKFREAVLHYSKKWLIKRNERLIDKKEKMFAKYVKNPLDINGVKLDSVVNQGPNGLKYCYRYPLRIGEKVKKIELKIGGELYDSQKILYNMPDAGPVTYYISSLSSLVQNEVRYEQKVIERDLKINSTAYITFKAGDSRYCDTLASNKAQMRRISDIFYTILSDNSFVADSLVIASLSSPEGGYLYNKRLSQSRANSIKEYLLDYMHRMNAYTVERIRAKYLLPFIEHLEQEIKKLDMRRAELTTKESKQLQTLQKQLDECREYHERLQVVAEQAISFDLDDGVVVNYAKFGDVLQKIK